MIWSLLVLRVQEKVQEAGQGECFNAPVGRTYPSKVLF